MNTRIKSIYHPVRVDAGLGSLRIEGDYGHHVEQLIKQVLFTNPGERVNRPDFGCGVRRMLFAPNGSAAASMAQVMIFQALDKWLGAAVKVEEVAVAADNEVLRITIVYLLKVRQQRRTLNFEVI